MVPPTTTSSAAALSITALESVLYYFNKLKDDQGNTTFAKPDTLYFEPTLYPDGHGNPQERRQVGRTVQHHEHL